MARTKLCKELYLFISDLISCSTGVEAKWSSRDGVRGKHNVVKVWVELVSGLSAMQIRLSVTGRAFTLFAADVAMKNGQLMNG